MDALQKALLVIVFLLLAGFICGGSAAYGQVNVPDGDVEIQIQYPVYLPLVNGIQPVVDWMTCKVTEMLDDGGWVETCTQPISDTRYLICTVQYTVEWRVVYKQCVIVS